jgi:RNA polymerase sigma factor (sigma-70 family)
MDGYLRRILVNENNSLWRRGWKRREHATEELPEPTPVIDKYDDGRGAALWDLVQTLPKKARAVLVLRYYEELSEAETAEVLGVSVGTVKSQTSRALAALRERTPAHLNPADRPIDPEEER